MKKRIFVLSIAAVMACSMVSTSALAAEPEEVSIQGVTQNASATVKDSGGNKYRMTGIATKYTKGGKVTTSYTTTLYYTGKKDSTDDYLKVFTVSGSITFVGNDGINTSLSDKGKNKSDHGGCSSEVKGLLYRTSTVTGYHSLETDKKTVSDYSVSS